MNYEELYSTVTPLANSLKTDANSVTRLQKAIVRDADSGNLTELKKSLAAIQESARQAQEKAEEIAKAVEAFDTRAYFKDGDFSRQLLEACAQRGIDVKGEKGVYEMFPYKVRIYGDTDRSEEVYLNKKKVYSFRPSHVADYIQQEQARLRKASFNIEAFMDELAVGYDTVCSIEKLRPGTSITLTKIYKALVPMARARKEYDPLAFAFDLARTYEQGPENWKTKKGRVFNFGTSRDGKSGIRVLSSAGIETYITTLHPLNSEE